MGKRFLVILTVASTVLALIGVTLLLVMGWEPLHAMILVCAHWLAALVHQ